MLSFLQEFWSFLKARKKLWLLPLIVVMLTMAALLFLGQGSALTPFIYTLF